MDWLIVFFATKLHAIIVAAALLVFSYAKRSVKLMLFKISLITLPLAFLVSRLLSALIYNPRPFVDGHAEQLIAHMPDNGFPSDHALLVFTIAAIVYSQDKLVGSVLIGLSVLVGIGRVAAGVHHVIDILGSVLIAFAATYVAVRILRRSKF